MLRKLCSVTSKRYYDGFFINADAFQDALNSCLSVRDWEILTGAIQIPENFVPMAYARLAELTVQEFEVS